MVLCLLMMQNDEIGRPEDTQDAIVSLDDGGHQTIWRRGGLNHELTRGLALTRSRKGLNTQAPARA